MRGHGGQRPGAILANQWESLPCIVRSTCYAGAGRGIVLSRSKRAGLLEGLTSGVLIFRAGLVPPVFLVFVLIWAVLALLALLGAKDDTA